MNQSAIKGRHGQIEFVVEQPHTIQLSAKESVYVLSSPSLIWFLELAAIEAVKNNLDDGEVSLGAEFQLHHLAPTPLHSRVTCSARVIQAENRSLGFQWEAYSNNILIARGFHKRHVVNLASFCRRLNLHSSTTGGD